ncbi:DEAD/DEAH box helicase [Aliiruegeria sabulilitoris]|uniref:DEAD/DEAH box helicase n=1 Tax=Aliiruegeria sabulilitoris TaxID=1510458 RepID=UPI00082EBBA1|nr:DEAD/DEAH box helicase [Aliiruegeria sabulilitoris]NDR58912.1 DEAD/DEAH box helicase [Pseudoruegeria sp. M32A2M]
MKKALADALQERGYTNLTPVQEAVTQPELEGADLLVSAQTGSGKTLGFGLAIAPTLLRSDEAFGSAGAPLALVIAPTRELALQVKRELAWLYAKAGAMVASCVGGMDMRDERRALARGAHVVVATPGRLRDHIMRGSIDLSAIRSVVLDEADEMLDLGFREDLEFILDEAPDTRQTLLFSATVPKPIEQLARSYQKEAVRIVTRSEASQHADIEYRAMLVADRDAESAVINTLRYHEAPNAIVFGNTREMVNRLTTRLSNRGFQVVALSGELSQTERSHALQSMRDGRARVCVATDVAARGLDLPNLDLVIHAQLPSNHETLLHRSGRTGRAGRKGVSALVVQPKFRKKAERLLAAAKIKAEWGGAPTAEAVLTRDEERLFADPIWQESSNESEPEVIARLVQSFPAEKIANAFLSLYRAQHSSPEELTEMDAAPKPRREFGPSVWFSLSIGRDSGADPRRILPMVCKAGGITKIDIGAIRLKQEESYVEIAEASADAFCEALGPGMIVEDGVVATRLDSPPSLPAGPRNAPSNKRFDAKSGPGKPRPAEAGSPKPEWKGKPKADWKDKPKADWKNKPKPDWKDKPKADWKDKPKPDWKDKPARAASPDSDEAAAPRKPRHKASKPAKTWDRSEASTSEGTDKPRKPYVKKGAPPPAGKPSSKKNKARAKPVAPKSARGGDALPRRKK